MAKKKITGKTKLSASISPANCSESLNLVSSKKEIMLPRSYRLRESDIESLKKIVGDVNEISTSRIISETNVLKALIFIGKKLKPERIVKACKEVW